jgi:hypothetical protein
MTKGHRARKIAFEEALRCFDRENPVKPGSSNGYARGLLKSADEKFGGRWGCISLVREDLLDIILPHHISEGGSIELIPRSGLTVAAAVQKLREISVREYQSANPRCWQKITYWKEHYPSPIFLSIVPMGETDYQDLVDYRNHLIHLDGLHRLIAWGLSGRFEPEEYEKGDGVTAYVAGLEEDGTN